MPAAGLLHGNNIHGERTIFANNWPNEIRHWLPMIDHPCDKATAEMIVTAPNQYQVVSNGVLATGFSGGTEYATAIFYGEKGVSVGRGPVVHEIAHQWWGNSVTERDWDDVWLSDGFATYFTLLFTEHDEGRDAFVDGLKRSRAQILQLEQKLPDTPVIHRNLSDMRKVLNGLVYLRRRKK